MGDAVLMHELEPLKEFQNMAIHDGKSTVPRTAGGSTPSLLQWYQNWDQCKDEVEA